jgi:hypothetical protein
MLKTLVLGKLIFAERAELSSAMVQRNTYAWILRLEAWPNMSEVWM